MTIPGPEEDVWFVYQRVRHALVSPRDLTLRYEVERDDLALLDTVRRWPKLYRDC